MWQANDVARYGATDAQIPYAGLGFFAVLSISERVRPFGKITTLPQIVRWRGASDTKELLRFPVEAQQN